MKWSESTYSFNQGRRADMLYIATIYQCEPSELTEVGIEAPEQRE